MTDLRETYREVAREVPAMGDIEGALQTADHRRRLTRVGTSTAAALLVTAGAVLVVTAPWQTQSGGPVAPGHTGSTSSRGGWQITPSYLSKCRTVGWTGCLTLAGSLFPATTRYFESIVRPLSLPQIRPGAVCPVSGRHLVSNAVLGGWAFGRGPVQLVVADSLRVQNRRAGPWYGFNSVWFAATRYSGPVLVRGERLDGPGRPAFRTDPAFYALASLGTSPTPGPIFREIRSWPDSLNVRSPGCYGFQVDGRGFSYDIVIQILPPKP